MRRIALVGVLLVPASAGADCPACTPIQNNSYAIDLYSGVPLGSSALIAMGGAGAANAMGSSGTLLNPSAPAVRPTTDVDWWSLDAHFDVLTSGKSTDNWNDGFIASNGAGTDVATVGIAGRLMDWAASATLTAQSAEFAMTATGPTFAAQTNDWRIAIARWFPRIDVAIGAAVRIAQFDIYEQMPAATGSTTVLEITGVGAEAGAQWIPHLRNLRVGAAFSSSIAGGNVSSINCDPTTCTLNPAHFPDEIYVPWRATVGVAYRIGPSRWNQLLIGTFRDERALTVVADVVATGAAPDAFGLEAFTHDEWERSGRHTAWSVRGGAELELLPGRLRLRGGSYYEPARFEGVSGRVHGTFGLDLRLFEFYAWGYRRGRIGFTGDLAERYDNFSLSIGFWH